MFIKLLLIIYLLKSPTNASTKKHMMLRSIHCTIFVFLTTHHSSSQGTLGSFQASEKFKQVASFVLYWKSKQTRMTMDDLNFLECILIPSYYHLINPDFFQRQGDTKKFPRNAFMGCLNAFIFDALLLDTPPPVSHHIERTSQFDPMGMSRSLRKISCLVPCALLKGFESRNNVILAIKLL